MKKLILALCMVVMVFALVGCGQKEKTPELTDAEKFAEENSISVELAQDIENALLQTDVPPSLNKLNEWKQIEDYADGQRYTGWIYSNVQEKYYYMMFYVKDDTVESIRDQKNGLEYLYQKTE
jgi:predicted small lipoprotein YifL|nr:MAG TPA: lipoprotein [Caudoviricetes sp.]